MGEASFQARWPRLLSEPSAAEYLSVSPTTFRTLGIRCRRIGRRVLYDRLDLDRWVDLAEDQPLDTAQRGKAIEDEERAFFERRQARGAH